MRRLSSLASLLALLSALFLPALSSPVSAQTSSCSGTALAAQTYTKTSAAATALNNAAIITIPAGATSVIVCWDTATPSNAEVATQWLNASGGGLGTPRSTPYVVQGTFTQAVPSGGATLWIDVAWQSAGTSSVHIAADWTFPGTVTPTSTSTSTSTPTPTNTPTATPIPATSTPIPPTPTPAIVGCSNPGAAFDSTKGTQYEYGTDSNDYQTCLNFASLNQLTYQQATQIALLSTQVAIPTNTPLPTSTPFMTSTPTLTATQQVVASQTGCIANDNNTNANQYQDCVIHDAQVRSESYVYWAVPLILVSIIVFGVTSRIGRFSLR